ncbi:LacI family DNA-binding transcriptional regulator [uncultured Faecalibaculum sp.]|uniref:RNA polymerase factor sigma-54 n=1 Tax=uncultured Faecalibaculum sp. TaxID=1729681 RepID=UPI0026389C1C|nr:LacI family DNA-binding transcriptional regulator [uncultured Faecalibaculum sp.]
MPRKLLNKQTQKQTLSLNQSMKKSLDILKMNEKELLEAIRDLTSTNPFLDYRPGKDLNAMLEESFALPVSLKEDLYLQLHTLRIPYDGRVCSYIIESLDDHGLFRESVQAGSAVMQCSGTHFAAQLRVVQSLEPAGVGARSQLESVLLQLERMGEADALHLMKTYPEALISGDLHMIREQEGWSHARIEALLGVIRSCQLNPCHAYDRTRAELLLPDFELIRHEDSVEIQLPDSGTLSLDQSSAESVKQDPVFRKFLEDAHFFVDALSRRKATLLVLMNALVEHQKNHFLFGDELEPCTLQDIAKETGVHESTVSRTLSNKHYLWGGTVHAVKDLFVSQTKGGTSRDSVLKSLQAFIHSEDPRHPYSDQYLADQFEALGMEVSRRAIAKYRGQLGIPSSSRRRKK